MQLVAMTQRHAADLVTWRYPAPFDCYDMTTADPAVVCDPGNQFFAVLENGAMIGFRSFGADGQVPGGDYDDSALDTGGGLRPDLVGRGRGLEVVRAGLEFGGGLFTPMAFRVTIAAFNTRALRTMSRLGFSTVSRFEASTDGRPYEVLLRAEHGVTT